MTLQNGLLHQGTAYMWSDTGWWDADGRRVGTAPKAFEGSLFPWAGTLSGVSPPGEPYRSVKLLADRLSLSPAEVIQDAVGVLKDEDAQGRSGRLLLAFQCPRRGAALCHIAADAMPDRLPFQPVMVGKYVCWGANEDWYAPFAGRDLTPAEMRQVVALQLQGNAAAMFEIEVQDPVSDVIETRVSRDGVSHTRFRLINGRLTEAEPDLVMA